MFFNVCVCVVCDVWRHSVEQERPLDLLELELQVAVSQLMCVLGADLRSSDICLVTEQSLQASDFLKGEPFLKVKPTRNNQ